jgi:hypothetical protein
MSATGPSGQVESAVEMSDGVRKYPISQNRLSEKQHAAIELLVLGKSLGAIAKVIEIDPRTLYRWRKDPDFADELEQRRDELWGAAAERLRALVHPSLDVLEGQLHDRYDRARFNAATMLLKLVDLRKVIHGARS